jgi:hypothetical protein
VHALALCRRTHSQAWLHCTWGDTVQHWAALGLGGLTCSLIAVVHLGRRNHQYERWRRWLLPSTTAADQPAWLRGLAVLQCFSSIYLVVLWVLETFGQLFV